MKDIVAMVYSLKWKWGGHILGMEQCRRAHGTLWDARLGKRRTGRPKTWWVDTLKTVAGGEWSQMAESRNNNVGKINVIDSADISVRWLHQYIQWCTCQTNRPKWNCITCSKCQSDVSRHCSAMDITAGGDFLVLCDQKSSNKHVSDFGRLRCYGHFLIPVHALVWTASYGTS